MATKTNINNRLTSVQVVKDSFLPEGSRDPITFYALLLNVKYHGDDDSVRIKLTSDQQKLLIASDVVGDSEETEENKKVDVNFLD